MFQGYVIIEAHATLLTTGLVDYGKVFRSTSSVKEKFNEIMKEYADNEHLEMLYSDAVPEVLSLDIWKDGEPWRSFRSCPIYY